MELIKEVAVGGLQCLAMLAGVFLLGMLCFRLHKWFDRQGKTYTVKAFTVFKGEAFEPMLIVHIDIVKAPGLLTPADGSPLYRATVNDRPWMQNGQGMDGVGYLFTSEAEAEETLRASLATTGFTSFCPLTEF